VNQLPIKEKTLQRKHRWFYYFLFEFEGKILVHLRTGKDIWQNLNEFYLLETEEQVKWDETNRNSLAERTDRHPQSSRKTNIPCNRSAINAPADQRPVYQG
jgi:adenine-specific DNA glycosylase